jgi:hypothetical protein
MFKRTEPKKLEVHSIIPQFPHCDSRVLHAPGECQYCDKHPDWQALRQVWNIAFTGYAPEGKELPCPADHARGDNHKKWAGNTAYPLNEANPTIAKVDVPTIAKIDVIYRGVRASLVVSTTEGVAHTLARFISDVDKTPTSVNFVETYMELRNANGVSLPFKGTSWNAWEFPATDFPLYLSPPVGTGG